MSYLSKIFDESKVKDNNGANNRTVDQNKLEEGSYVNGKRDSAVTQPPASPSLSSSVPFASPSSSGLASFKNKRIQDFEIEDEETSHYTDKSSSGVQNVNSKYPSQPSYNGNSSTLNYRSNNQGTGKKEEPPVPNIAPLERRLSEQEEKEKKKGLVTLNDLNEKFMSSNFYWIILAIILYIGIGIGIFHEIMGWSRFDSFYFVIITVSTVGYGDYIPKSENQRVFTAFYILIGVAIVGSLLGTITTFVSDHQDRMAKLRSMRAMVKMKETAEGISDRQSTVSTTSAFSGGIPLLKWQFPNITADNPLYTDTTGHDAMLEEARASSSSSTSAGEISSHSATILTGDGEGGVGVGGNGSGKPKRRQSTIEVLTKQLSLFSTGDKKREKTLTDLREASIAAYEEDRYQLRKSAILDFFLIWALIIFGMLVMSGIEGWSTADSFYWATETVMTVGYGDIVPNTVEGKVFTMIYVAFGCSFMAKAITDFVKFPLLSRLLHNEISVVNQFTGDLSPEMLEALFQNELYQIVPDLRRNENEMSKCEFVLLMLQVMNKVEEKDIFLAAKLFDNFDKRKNGSVSFFLLFL
jgi:voltage-gated potassium channel